MRIAIVHPWFPQYRRPFFDELIRIGSARDFQIDVFHGETPPEWIKRGDAASADYAKELRTSFLGIGRRHLVLKWPFDVWRNGPHDLIILEQAVRNIETYAFLALPTRSRIAFWGHGRTYTKKVGVLQERLKEYVTRQGDWFFAYTPGGRDAVTKSGFPSERTTVLNNAIDASALEMAIENLVARDSEEFAKRFDLRGKTGLFIGGLDESKRLDFLLAAADLIYAADDEFRLLVAGSGQLRSLVESAATTRPWLTYLGPLFGEAKALAMRSADLLLMPGRVGLVAVDSFASRTPIVTTNWPWHAPEFEYLEHGYNALVTDDDLNVFSEVVVSILSQPAKLGELKAGAASSAHRYTVAAMATNFLDGLEKWREIER